jgi:hypothetical protein
MRENMESVLNELDRVIISEQTPSTDFEQAIMDWMIKNPNFKDADLHKWAEGTLLKDGKNKLTVHDVETYIYKVATIGANFLAGGRFNKSGKKESDFDKKQIDMGIKVEMEHTVGKGDIDKEIAKRISLDHLTESGTYYTYLDEMEKKFKKD